MTPTLSPLDHELDSELKDYLIFRADDLDGDRELADESALEAEAARYADLRAAAEGEAGIHYEVRFAATGALLYATADHHREEAPWLQTAMW